MRYQPLARLAELPAVDVLVCCLGSGATPLDDATLPPVRQLAVDLGTPRTITGVAGAPVITIADMLAADGETPHRDARRARLQARLREVLERRLAMADDGGSPVGLLRAEVERLREAEVRRIARLHPELPPETVETITRSLINQVFHRPTERLRANSDPEFGQRLVELFASEEALP
jgi:glutamyl-tRNA reductase